jgi:sorting nexin-4
VTKDVLKMRDQKQLEHEDLCKFLNNQNAEKQKLLNPALRGSGISSFLREKYDEIKGLNNEISRKERLDRVELKIKEVGLICASLLSTY